MINYSRCNFVGNTNISQKSLGGIVGGKRSKGNNDQEADNEGAGGDDGGEVQLRNKRGRSEQLNGQVMSRSTLCSLYRIGCVKSSSYFFWPLTRVSSHF